MLNFYPQTALLSLALMLSGTSIGTAQAADEPAQPAGQTFVQKEFMQAFQPYCGQAFAARIVEDNQPSPAWDHPLVVHVRDCEDAVIRMPLHVGEDRSRTWVLSLHEGFIDFQHFHLHQDGSPDAVSPYGGKTADAGTPGSQSFPVDEASKALFIANGLEASVNNTWSIDFPDANTLRYRLLRPGRLFEVHVDLSQPVSEPPPAWGYSR